MDLQLHKCKKKLKKAARREEPPQMEMKNLEKKHLLFGEALKFQSYSPIAIKAINSSRANIQSRSKLSAWLDLNKTP